MGGPIAVVKSPVINPNNLHIDGWRVTDNRSGRELILLSKDVREIIDKGLIVNDHEVLSPAKDLIRLKDVMQINFLLTGVKVQSISKQSYGKVIDFAFDSSSFYIQKIYSGQPILKSLSGNSLSIDRSQIIEITPSKIIIEDPTIKVSDTEPALAPAN
jgi:hypothetical protein